MKRRRGSKETQRQRLAHLARDGYRQIEYALVQGIGCHLEMVRLRWASVGSEVVTGQAHTKAAAIAAAEKAIDRAPAVKKGGTRSAPIEAQRGAPVSGGN